jgi:hypothetical protein
MSTPERTRCTLLAAAFSAAFFFAPEALASTSAVGIFKQHFYAQTSGSTPTAATAFPYAFSVSGSGSGSLTIPGGSSVSLPEAFAANAGNGDLLDDGFASEASLEATYPNGAYQLSLAGEPKLTYTLGSPLYPASIPQVTNGTWQSGVLVVDPTTAATLTISPFAEYATAGVAGYMSIQVNSAGQDNVNLKQQYATFAVGNGTTTSSTPFTSFTIPANTLTPGYVYQCGISFDTVGALDTTTIPGAASVQLYINTTIFYIVAKSPTAIAAPTVNGTLANQTGPLGGSATFTPSVSFGSSQEPAATDWFWTYNGQFVSLNGSKYILGPGGSLTINNLTAADAGSYQLVVATGGGLAASTAATLTIGAASSNPPTITKQPITHNIANGSTVVFHVEATAASTYQWLFNGSPLSNGGDIYGATSQTLLIKGATFSNAGGYTCAVSNPAGTTTSASASLTVTTTTDPGRLINISCRAGVGTGGNILIAGFVSGGEGTSGTEPVLIRGTGPALIPFGVGGTLPDPELKLYQSNPDGSSTLLLTNNGWGGNASITAEDSAVGAFALTNPASADSALYVPSLASGGYTAQIAGASGDTGVALAEVYDATPPGTYTPASPRIVNISARVQVGTQSNILIAGIVIGGTTAKTLLIRASGPALVPFGVTGTLPDPELSLYQSNPDGSSTELVSNTGWGGGTVIANTAASVGAFSWTNPASADSALVVTLPPGGYTVQVAGAAGTATDTGVALVEVYDVP